MNEKKLARLIVRLEPIEFIGFAKICGASIVDENNEPLDFNDILPQVINGFNKLNPKLQKSILAALH